MADANSIYSLFKTDKNAETVGVWKEVGASSFLLARAGGSNTRFLNLVASAFRPAQRRIQMGSLSVEESRAMSIGPFIDGVLLDWKNVPAEDGTPLAFSKDNAKKLLTDLPDLFETLQQMSQDISNYSAYVEDAAKN